jgi:hypothetical protein
VLEREIYMVANRLIERFGDDAGLRAAERALELKKIGDAEGAARFALVVAAVKAILAEAPKGGARLH